MTIHRHDRLTVSWNWINFLQLSNTFLPHLAALKMELKSSSTIRTAACAFVMSQPELVANPTEAAAIAGASLSL